MSTALSDYEIERGKPMPSQNHSIIQLRLGRALLAYEDRFNVMSELSLDLNGWKSAPDICIYPVYEIDWTNDVLQLTEPPLLVIEIASPTQGMDDLIEKMHKYFAAGVPSCWIVQPYMQAIAVYTPGKNRPQTYTTGDLIDPATGIKIEVDRIFR